MSSAPSFWRGAKKEALDNAERAVAELNELGFHYILTEGAEQRPQQQERPANPPRKLKLRSAKRETSLAPFAISKRPRIMMAECTGHKRPKSHSLSRNLWKGILRRLSSFVVFHAHSRRVTNPLLGTSKSNANASYTVRLLFSQLRVISVGIISGVPASIPPGEPVISLEVIRLGSIID